jgi:hypothetical protein
MQRSFFPKRLALPFYHVSAVLALVSLLVLSAVLVLPTAIADASAIVAETGSAKKLPPPLADALRRDLSQRVKLPFAKLRVVEATSKRWPDGCLGLARPNEFCTQALVNGWRVVLSDGNKRWIYRTDQRGRVMRLEKPLSL